MDSEEKVRDLVVTSNENHWIIHLIKIVEILNKFKIFKYHWKIYKYFVSIEFRCRYCWCAQLATGHVGVPSRMTRLLKHLPPFNTNKTKRTTLKLINFSIWWSSNWKNNNNLMIFKLVLFDDFHSLLLSSLKSNSFNEFVKIFIYSFLAAFSLLALFIVSYLSSIF